MKKLVILESPNKIKKVSTFLKNVDKNNEYIVKASVGHFRELASDGDYNFGIDLSTMNPRFVNTKDKKSIIDDLKNASVKVDEILLATDPDREGEAIAWHLMELLKFSKKPFKRMLLNSITEEEVKKKLNDLKGLDQAYVDSALTRQMLDRVVGFRLSPIIQEMVGGGSGGRVQSAILLLLATREKEINGFASNEYYYLQDNLFNEKAKNVILDEKNNYVTNKIFSKDEIEGMKKTLSNQYAVENIKISDFEDKTYLPFSTSGVLQSAKSNLKFKVKETTNLLQQLFEKGLITYIRTDSTNLDQETEENLKSFFIKNYGESNLGKLTKKQVKDTDQEGHPAITPTHFEWMPQDIEKHCDSQLSEKEINLYSLIWQNTINSISKRPGGQKAEYLLNNNGLKFILTKKEYKNLGYINIDKSNIFISDKNEKFDSKLLSLKLNEKVNVNKIEIIADKDKPKSRFNEATLVSEMEKKGIGRPSTFKQCIDTNLNRKYIEVDKKDSICVTELGMKVNDFLQREFSEIINLDYTKTMEGDLDKIAKKQITDYKKYLKDFYKKLDGTISKIVFSGEKCPKCKVGNVLSRVSKKGTKFKGCNKYPNCDFVEFEAPDYSNKKKCNKCNVGFMIDKSYKDKKTNKLKKFKGCSNYPNCKNAEF